jgi:hypothetical protein
MAPNLAFSLDEYHRRIANHSCCATHKRYGLMSRSLKVQQDHDLNTTPNMQ